MLWAFEDQHLGYIGIMGLYWGCIGLYWDYVGIMEKKMEATI